MTCLLRSHPVPFRPQSLRRHSQAFNYCLLLRGCKFGSPKENSPLSGLGFFHVESGLEASGSNVIKARLGLI